MAVSATTTEKSKPVLNQAGNVPRPEAANGTAQSELPSVNEASDNKEDAVSPKKKRPLRWVVLLLAVGLVWFGYTQRERLLELIPSRLATKHTAAEAKPAKVLYWVDPMHPAYKSDKPGTAPDCGMDLVPVYEAGASQAANNSPEGTIHISPEKQQLIGVQYGVAVYKPVYKTLRTVGRLTWDETKIAHVHSRVEGWIEQVFVDFVGKRVKKGQPLVSVYSPELWQTQQEYLLAVRSRKELANSPFREAVASSESLLEAARHRLELWDIGWEQLEHIEHTGKPIKALNIYSPSDGFVITRNAYMKQRLMPETEIYTIADTSTIWVLADIYEFEAQEIKLGQSAAVTLTYFPGKTFRGKVTYLYPQLDNATRTLKARIEIPNQDFALKPDMYANVELGVSYGKQVVVPQEAVMDSGAEQQVFVAHEGGYFEPRRVQLGAKVDNEFIVLGGLKAGERIVTSANFLIDSESKLKSAAGGMGMPGMDHGDGKKAGRPQTDHSEHTAAPTTPDADHSQHRTGDKPTPKPEDHSQHQPQAVAPAKIEDHSAHSKAAAAHDHAGQTGKVLYYYCPMHEGQRSDKPGDCPKCKMRLIPKHAANTEGGGL